MALERLRHPGELLQRLVDPILADVVQARLDGGRDVVRRMTLGDRDDPDLRRVATDPRARRRY
jgi:hypothetical protein